MGVGGKFWDLLKPYARNEGFDYLRGKKVAVDLSIWIVQHELVIKRKTRSPHLRLTFFRTINLFSKFGAYPVFVIDGTPSPLKSKARAARFARSHFSITSLPEVEDRIPSERNQAFSKCVEECMELLELLGMPVMQAQGEAEALCAQLNKEGYVDACLTSDSDAFLFGAKCVIKSIRPNSREPFECYHGPDIEAGLGLKRKHLIAISLLVGNDHDLLGIEGIGVDTAVRFAQNFSEDEILDRICDMGKGEKPLCFGGVSQMDDPNKGSVESLKRPRLIHCSFCGHPGTKRQHVRLPCEYCGNGRSGCIQKATGFKCNCSFCIKEREEKEGKKSENWWIKVWNKIAQQPHFPNYEILELYLCNDHRNVAGVKGWCLTWGTPDTEALSDILVFKLRWEPSYVRKMLFPMLSTMYMREIAKTSVSAAIYGQYEFHSVERKKYRYGHPYFVVKWQKAVSGICAPMNNTRVEEVSRAFQGETVEDEEPVDLWNDLDEHPVHFGEGHWYLLTDEDRSLVQSAFPEQVNQFLQEKIKQEHNKPRRRKRSTCSRSDASTEVQTSPGVQRSITVFYCTMKLKSCKKKLGYEAKNPKDSDGIRSKGKDKSKVPNANFSKSVRRRLLFE